MASGCINHIVCGSKAPEQCINMRSIVLFGLVHKMILILYKNHYYIMTIQVKATKQFYYMYKWCTFLWWGCYVHVMRSVTYAQLASHTSIFRGARISSLPTNACATENNMLYGWLMFSLSSSNVLEWLCVCTCVHHNLLLSTGLVGGKRFLGLNFLLGSV